MPVGRRLSCEEALLPVRLIFDDELPKSINSVVLSYTIFDVTDYNNIEFAQRNSEYHANHEMGPSI